MVGFVKKPKLVQVDLVNQQQGLNGVKADFVVVDEHLQIPEVKPEVKAEVKKEIPKAVDVSKFDGTALTIIKKDGKYIIGSIKVNVDALDIIHTCENKGEANEKFKIEVVKHGLI